MVAAGNIRLLLLWYRQQLSERPYITNAATAGLVMFVGDRLAQHISRRRQLQTADCRSSQCCRSEAKPIDAEATEPHVAQRPLAVDLTHGVGSWVRTATMTSWATGVYAPWFVLWYTFLNKRWPHMSARHALAKVAANLVLALPVNALFMTYATGMEFSLLGGHRVPSQHGKQQPLSELRGATQLARHTALWQEVEHKLETRYQLVILSSSLFWAPTNFVIFTTVLPLYRVVWTMLAGVLWNAYLSWAQHDLSEGSNAEDS